MSLMVIEIGCFVCHEPRRVRLDGYEEASEISETSSITYNKVLGKQTKNFQKNPSIKTLLLFYSYLLLGL